MAVMALVKLTMLLLVVLLATHKVLASCSTTLTTHPTSKLRSHLVAFLATACPHKARAKGQQARPPKGNPPSTDISLSRRCNLHTCQHPLVFASRPPAGGHWGGGEKDLSAKI